MRALVTGATGFIGSHLVSELRVRGWEVVCLTRRAVIADDLGITCFRGDLLDPGSLDLTQERMGHIDALFHLGAVLPSRTAPIESSVFVEANGASTLRLLDSAVRIGAKSFVYLSSVSVIGKPEESPVNEAHPLNPPHPYALGKLWGELACEMMRKGKGFKVTSLRVASPYGPGMPRGSVLPKFVQDVLQSKDIAWQGSGKRTQDFVHVRDVVKACLLAASTEHPMVYNIGSGKSISMKALAMLVVKLTTGCKSKASAAGTPDPQDDYRWKLDIRKARDFLGYKPSMHLEQGLIDFIDFIRADGYYQPWWKHAK